jgi:hypothetical protein
MKEVPPEVEKAVEDYLATLLETLAKLPPLLQITIILLLIAFRGGKISFEALKDEVDALLTKAISATKK